MNNSTSKTYQMKREFLSFSNKISRHLNKRIPVEALKSYLTTIRKWIPSEPVIHIDDSDVVKPDGRKFDALLLLPVSKRHLRHTFVCKRRRQALF